MQNTVIDRFRHQIQQRLDQIASEIDRLRRALSALDPRSSARPPRQAPVRRRAQPATPAPKPAATTTEPARRTSQSTARSTTVRAPSGATKAAVLEALAGGEAMTASQVATKAGVARATVSTTLSKLAKSGEVQKAERGYRLAPRAPGD